MSENIGPLLDAAYEAMDGSEASARYSARHNISSAAILTVFDDETAGLVAERLAPKVEGKTVVEIGGGIGLLAMHLGQYAKRVYCIEANPVWSWIFVEQLLHAKPKNVSFLFGAADEFIGQIRGDVAVYCTHSDVFGMGLIAAQFAPVVVDFYGELIAENPQAYDPLARQLRQVV